MALPKGDEWAAAMYERYQAGLTLEQVAGEFGITFGNVSKAFRRRGWPTRRIWAPEYRSNHDKGAEKQCRTMRRRYAAGEIEPWNKGQATEGVCARCRKVRLLFSSGQYVDHCASCAATLRIRESHEAHSKAIARQRRYRQSAKGKRHGREGRLGGNWGKAMERAAGVCQLCDAKATRVHHIDGRGGNLPKVDRNDDLSNLMALCESCHRTIHRAIKRGCEPMDALGTLIRQRDRLAAIPRWEQMRRAAR